MTDDTTEKDEACDCLRCRMRAVIEDWVEAEMKNRAGVDPTEILHALFATAGDVLDDVQDQDPEMARRGVEYMKALVQLVERSLETGEVIAIEVHEGQIVNTVELSEKGRKH